MRKEIMQKCCWSWPKNAGLGLKDCPQFLTLKIGHQDSSPSNDQQGEMPHCQLLVTQVTGSAITGKYCQESQTYRTNHLQAKIFISVIDQNQNGVKSGSQTCEESHKINPTWESHNECNHQV